MTGRGSKTRLLWWALWFFWLAVMLQQIVLDARFGAPIQLLIIQVCPLAVFIPWVAKDNLTRSYLVDLCFTRLFCLGGADCFRTT